MFPVRSRQVRRPQNQTRQNRGIQRQIGIEVRTVMQVTEAECVLRSRNEIDPIEPLSLGFLLCYGRTLKQSGRNGATCSAAATRADLVGIGRAYIGISAQISPSGEIAIQQSNLGTANRIQLSVTRCVWKFDGTGLRFTVEACPLRTSKAKSLSFQIGPPIVEPNWWSS